jgi:hypothetical protein
MAQVIYPRETNGSDTELSASQSLGLVPPLNSDRQHFCRPPCVSGTEELTSYNASLRTDITALALTCF